MLKQFLPKQDVILIRAEDPRVEHSGIVAGMSGSPVYIDGKLVGAVAYAWSFAKEPLGGVTPIENMLAERARPRRKTPLELAAGGDDGAASGFPALADAHLSAPSEGGLVQASVPLSVSGFTPRTMAELGDLLRPVGLVPMQAGGGRALTAGKLSSSARRASGRPSASAPRARGHEHGGHGHRDLRRRVALALAFGHPMFGIGESYLPLVDAEIHAFLPTLAQSFKLSSPLHEIGVLVQDRQSCIIGRGNLDGRTTMMPVNVRITGPEGKTRTFNAEVARSRRLTPMLASLVVGNAVADAEPDVTDVIATVSGKLTIQGRGTLELTDQVFSTEGILGPRARRRARLRALGELMFNPFEPRLSSTAWTSTCASELRRGRRRHRGRRRAHRDRARGRHRARARDAAALRRPRGHVETAKPVKIPLTVRGRRPCTSRAASGVMARPGRGARRDARRLHREPGHRHSTRRRASSSRCRRPPDEGAALRGHLIADLPASAMDTLRPANQTRRADSYRIAERTVFPSKRLVTGRQELTVAVVDDVLGHNR